MLRILDANRKNGYNTSVISRSRNKIKNKPFFKEIYEYKNKTVYNYIIEVLSERGAGIRNIMPLIKYQLYLFYVLFKKRKEVDILHAFDLDTGLVALLYSKLYKKKVVYHIADFYADSRSSIPRYLEKILRRIEEMVINNSDATIIANENRREQIKGSKPRKLTVIHNSPMIDRNELDFIIKKKNVDQYKFSKNGIFLSYVGGLSKGRFINEILDIAIKNPELTLTIAGYGPLEEKVKKYSNEYININYLGELDYQEALIVYSLSDIMFAMYDPSLPNHKYSAPNKVYEAMMLGKPIIVAKDSGIDALVREENIGLVSKYDSDSFTEKLNGLINNKKKAKKLEKNAIESYNKYSWDKMVERLNTLYKSLTGPK